MRYVKLFFSTLPSSPFVNTSDLLQQPSLSRDLLQFSPPCPKYSCSPTPHPEPAQGFPGHISLSSAIKWKLVSPGSSLKLFRILNAGVSNLLSTAMCMCDDIPIHTLLPSHTRISAIPCVQSVILAHSRKHTQMGRSRSGDVIGLSLKVFYFYFSF